MDRLGQLPGKLPGLDVFEFFDFHIRSTFDVGLMLRDLWGPFGSKFNSSTFDVLCWGRSLQFPFVLSNLQQVT